MSYIAKELRQKRASVIQAARAMVEGDNVSAEDNSRFDELMNQANTLKSQYERIEKAAAIEAEMSEAREIKAEVRKVSVAQVEDEKVREDRILTQYLRGGFAAMSDADRVHAMTRFQAAQSTGTNSAGGFTVAPDTTFMSQIEKKLAFYGGMRNVARVIKTENGAPLPIPTMDDTTNIGEIVAEGTAMTQQDVTFGQVSLNAYMYSSKMILVPIQLLQDSAVDVPDLLSEALVNRIGRIQNQHFTSGLGSGSSQPAGVITGAAVGRTGVTGQTTSVTYADLVHLEHSIDRSYRTNDGCTWMFHDSTLNALKRLVDTTGRPIFNPGITVGEPDRILGYRYEINNDMPVMAANAKSILFGAMKYYWVRDVMGLTVRRLDERYAETLSVAFFAATRAGGALISAGQPVKWYANSAT